MTTPEQRSKNAARARKYRASAAGVAYRKTDKYRQYHKNWKRSQRTTPEGKLRAQKHNITFQLKKYGLTWADWDQMLIEQAGRCAICSQPINPSLREPAVDHCHKTGKVRGLLHANCNAAIGLLEEDLERFFQAADYLRSHS